MANYRNRPTPSWCILPRLAAGATTLLLAAPGSSAAAPRPAAQACFAPGTSPKLVEEIGRVLAGSAISLGDPAPGFQFSDGDRWQATATDGGGLDQGDPTTLTWSYVPDGTSVCGFIGEPTAPSSLHAWLNTVYGNQATWHAVFQQVFDRWSAITGTRYVYEPNDDGAALGCSSLPGGVLGVRGDLRITAHPLDGNYNVLGYNFFPNAGDMVLDSGDSFYNDLSNGSRKMRNVLAHEHGHGLGLYHACPVNQTKLMEPYVSTAFDGPQHDDFLAINRGYGDDLEHNENSGGARSLGALAPGTPVGLASLSIDDNLDVDFLSFDVDTSLRATIDLSPVGFSYLSGPQVSGSCSAGSSYNSLAIHDLALTLLDRDGVTPLATANATGSGAGESLSDILLASPGTYFLRVAGSAADAAQLYSLAVTAMPATAPQLSLSQSLTGAPGPVPVGRTLDFTLVAANSGNGEASGVVMRACLDPGFDPAQLSIADGGLLNTPPAPQGCASNWISWSLPGPIPADDSSSVRYSAVVPFSTPDASVLGNSSEVASDQTAAQPGNTVTAAVCAPQPSLNMASNAATHMEGDTITWTLDIQNPHALCSLTAIEVSDTIDLSLVEDQPTLTWNVDRGSVALNGDTLSWSLPGLNPGESGRMTISSRIRTGSGGNNLCNAAASSFAEGAAAVASNSVCSPILSPNNCPLGGVAAADGLHVALGPGAADVTVSWSAVSLAEAYDLWRIEGDKTAIGLAGRGALAPVVAVPGCADPTPASGTSCVDAGALASPGLLFYQVRGVCAGEQGAL